jgi:hypothetical protein
VREFIEWYAKAIHENGYVPCCVSAAGADPVPEHDSHGQMIYLVAEYYRHTGDRALVERMLPTIRRVVAFIDKLRHERMTRQYENTAFYGMAPSRSATKAIRRSRCTRIGMTCSFSKDSKTRSF